MDLLIKFFVFTVIAAISPQVSPGIKVRGTGAAALVALVFGICNVLIGWLLTGILTFFSLPLIWLTLGLFKIVVTTIINAILLKITDAVLEPFELDGWGPAFVMGFLFALGSLATSWL
ncbi:MAG: phage holin family protein [Acidobacteriota bacterium]